MSFPLPLKSLITRSLFSIEPDLTDFSSNFQFAAIVSLLPAKTVNGIAEKDNIMHKKIDVIILDFFKIFTPLQFEYINNF